MNTLPHRTQALHRYAVRQLLSGSDKAERGEMLGGSSSSGSGMALLPELYVDSFDAEQIWVQVDTATAAALRRARRLIKKAQGGGSSSVQLIKEEFQESIDAMLAAADGKDLGEDEESEDDESEEEEGESDGEEGSDGGDGGEFEGLCAGTMHPLGYCVALLLNALPLKLTILESTNTTQGSAKVKHVENSTQGSAKVKHVGKSTQGSARVKYL